MTVSEQAQNIVIHTGGDPRHLPEFEAIRSEINKINHPMQPEVDWKLIESLALTVFRRNGVDLQTTVYYTLARMRLAGLAGFTEGCELLAGVVTAEWERCWPDNEAARIEILDWFNAKAGNVLRTLSFNEKNLRLLYRAERALQLINDKLQQVPLRRVPKIENLLIFIQNTGRRVEQKNQKEPATARRAPTETLVWMPVAESPPGLASALPTPEPVATEMPSAGPVAEPLIVPAVAPGSAVVYRKTRWRFQGFSLGVLCSLAAAVCAYYVYVMPMKDQLAQVARQPLGSALLWLGQPDVESYGQQLNRLATAPPYSVLELGERSVALAQQRWPLDTRQRVETQRWRAAMQAANETTIPDGGYVRVQQRLESLSNELLEQERVRGGLTISYLKTAVYQMQSAMAADVPLEALLGQLEVITRDGKPAPAGLLKQINDRWGVINGHYYKLTHLSDPSLNPG